VAISDSIVVVEKIQTTGIVRKSVCHLIRDINTYQEQSSLKR
jgi:hypothetical protein